LLLKKFRDFRKKFRDFISYFIFAPFIFTSKTSQSYTLALEYLSLIFAAGWVFYVPKIYYSVMSVLDDIGLSCIQWRAANCQGRHCLKEQHAELSERRSRPTLQWASVLRHASTSHSGTKSQDGSFD